MPKTKTIFVLLDVSLEDYVTESVVVVRWQH